MDRMRALVERFVAKGFHAEDGETCRYCWATIKGKPLPALLHHTDDCVFADARQALASSEGAPPINVSAFGPIYRTAVKQIAALPRNEKYGNEAARIICGVHIELRRLEFAGEPLLTSEDVIARSERKKVQPWWFSLWWLFSFVTLLAIMAVSLYEHVHDLLHRYTLGFWMGVVLGSVLELGIIVAARWTWHRYNWIRWFSRMG